MKRVRDTAITNAAWEGVRKGADGAAVEGMLLNDYEDGTGNVEFRHGCEVVGADLKCLDPDHVRDVCERLGKHIRSTADDSVNDRTPRS